MYDSVHLPHSLLVHWARALVLQARVNKSMKATPTKPDEWLSRVQEVMRMNMRSIHELWEAYNTDRERIGRYLNNPKVEAMAYGLGFHLANVARSTALLSRSQVISTLKSTRHLRVFDVGCGSGAMSQSFSAALIASGYHFQSVQWELADVREPFLEMATSMIEPYWDKHADFKLVTRKQKVDIWAKHTMQSLTEQKPDGDTKGMTTNVFLFGYLINELTRDKRALEQLKRVLRHPSFAQNPTVILILDSANEQVSQLLMHLRDELVGSGHRVLYPCLHQLACPMLQGSNDRCYSEFVWKQPREQKILDQKLGLKRKFFSGSAYAFVSAGMNAQLIPERNAQKTKAATIVGRPVLKDQQSWQEDASFTLLNCEASGSLSKSALLPVKSTDIKHYLRGSLSGPQ